MGLCSAEFRVEVQRRTLLLPVTIELSFELLLPVTMDLDSNLSCGCCAVSSARLLGYSVQLKVSRGPHRRLPSLAELIVPSFSISLESGDLSLGVSEIHRRHHR